MGFKSWLWLGHHDLLVFKYFPGVNSNYDHLEITSYQPFQNLAWAGQTMLSTELVLTGQPVTSCFKTQLELFFQQGSFVFFAMCFWGHCPIWKNETLPSEQISCGLEQVQLKRDLAPSSLPLIATGFRVAPAENQPWCCHHQAWGQEWCCVGDGVCIIPIVALWFEAKRINLVSSDHKIIFQKISASVTWHLANLMLTWQDFVCLPISEVAYIQPLS